MKADKFQEYTDKGCEYTIKVTLPYDELLCLELPESCDKCPVGYSEHNCGRNIPFKSEDYIKRPDTCKLIKTDILDILLHIKNDKMEVEWKL